MREIKFRAWNNINNRYYQNVQDTYDETIGDSFQDVLFNKNLVVEQFTGLKDKNGVDIYENDIIKSSGDNVEVVIYIDGRFEPVCWYGGKTYEVLGNVHENQELLREMSNGGK